MPDFINEFEMFAEAYAADGGNPLDLKNDRHLLMAVRARHLLAKNEIHGLLKENRPLLDGIKTNITVTKNSKIKNPVHFCFDVRPSKGTQRVQLDFLIKDNVEAVFWAHCTFPNAVKVRHIMEGFAKVSGGSRMENSKTLFHDDAGGVDVSAKMKIEIEKGGQYISTFRSVKGSAGKEELDYEASLTDEAATELCAKIYGRSHDEIRVKESVYLEANESRGLVKSRIILAEEARAEVLGGKRSAKEFIPADISTA